MELQKNQTWLTKQQTTTNRWYQFTLTLFPSMMASSIKSSDCLPRRNPWYWKMQTWRMIRQAWNTPRAHWAAVTLHGWTPKSEHQGSDSSFTEFPGLDAEKEVTKLVFYSKGHWLCLYWWVEQSTGFKWVRFVSLEISDLKKSQHCRLFRYHHR